MLVESKAAVSTRALSLATLQHHSLHQTFTESGMLTLPSHLLSANDEIHFSFFSWQPTDFSYSIRESTLHDHSMSISESPKLYDILFGQYIRLYVYIPRSIQSLALQLTPQESCDPDLYLSLGSQPIHQVTSTAHQLRSNHWGNQSEYISIDSKSPYFCMDCIASIAIYGYAGGKFSIEISANSSIQSFLRNAKSNYTMPTWITFLLVLLGAFSLPLLVYMNYARIEHILSTWFNRRKVHDFNRKMDGASRYVAPTPELSKDEIVRYLSLSGEENSDGSPLFESTSEEKMLFW